MTVEKLKKLEDVIKPILEKNHKQERMTSYYMQRL